MIDICEQIDENNAQRKFNDRQQDHWQRIQNMGSDQGNLEIRDDVDDDKRDPLRRQCVDKLKISELKRITIKKQNINQNGINTDQDEFSISKKSVFAGYMSVKDDPDLKIYDSKTNDLSQTLDLPDEVFYTIIIMCVHEKHFTHYENL